jgi:hypothetical protein
MLSAATRAEYSPKEWPANILGSAFESVKNFLKYRNEVAKRAGCVIEVRLIRSSGPFLITSTKSKSKRLLDISLI